MTHASFEEHLEYGHSATSPIYRPVAYDWLLSVIVAVTLGVCVVLTVCT